MSSPHTPAELLERLNAYAFPPMLAERLAAEQGWTPDFTAQVLAEYRQFLYLACVSPRPVTPSKQVDEAWHEHLTLTRDYWERLCGEVLGRPIHHDVAESGALQASAEYDGVQPGGTEEAYYYTLDVYAKEFGKRAPEAVWHDPRTSKVEPSATEITVKPPRFALIHSRFGPAAMLLLNTLLLGVAYVARNILPYIILILCLSGALFVLWIILKKWNPIIAFLVVTSLTSVAILDTPRFGLEFLVNLTVSVFSGVVLIAIVGGQFKGSVLYNDKSARLAGAGVGVGGGDSGGGHGGGHGGCGGGGCGGGGCGGGGCGGGG